jgi:pyridoxal phosphate enzyme (YggS family)
MTHAISSAAQLAGVRDRIAASARAAGRDPSDVTLIAVSKTFDTEAIAPVIEDGQIVFGENRVQEAQAKWPDLKAAHPGIELHLIGPLQSNKAAEAVALFDVIHTVDRPKIAAALAREMARQGRTLRLFVQVNTGEEPQKAGVAPADADHFLASCREVHGLTIAGLMCIPPADDDPGPHFALLREIAVRNRVTGLSMGMSGDFEAAIAAGATHVRVGSAIFGGRPRPQV